MHVSPHRLFPKALLLCLALFSFHPAWGQKQTYIFERDSALNTVLIDSVPNISGREVNIFVPPGKGADTVLALKKLAASGLNVPGDSSTSIVSDKPATTADRVKDNPYNFNYLAFFLTLGIGALVGYSELLNRYKSYKRTIISNFYSISYVVINASAAALFYWLVISYQWDLGSLTRQPVGLAITCGLGAMAFLRSSIFNYKDSGGKVIEIGPAALLTIFLRASERNFDQCLAKNSIESISDVMLNSELKLICASKDLPLLVLTSMQVLRDDEQKALATEVTTMMSDNQTTDEVKKILLGTILERYAGIELLRECVSKLTGIYQKQRQQDFSLLDKVAGKLST